MDNIGELLKNTRLAKGLSLEKIEEATSIRKIYLSAVEEGNYDRIPGDVFTKGIIRTYGNYLGLNGPELVTIYKAAASGVDPEEIKPVEIRTTSQISVAPHLKPQKSSFGILTYVAAFLVLLVVGAAGYMFLATGTNVADNTANPDTAVANSKTVTTSEPSEQEKEKIEAEARKAKERAEQEALSERVKNEHNAVIPNSKPKDIAENSKDGVNLYMYCNDRCWVEVSADGKKVFEGTLVSNEDKTFSAEKKIVVKYGNIKAMQIAVNGAPVSVEKIDGVVIREYKK